jgi:hypothetical protein
MEKSSNFSQPKSPVTNRHTHRAEPGFISFGKGPRARKDVLQFFPFDGGATRKLANIERPTEIGLALSPDERMIVYCQVDHLSSELMLVEDSVDTRPAKGNQQRSLG